MEKIKSAIFIVKGYLLQTKALLTRFRNLLNKITIEKHYYYLVGVLIVIILCLSYCGRESPELQMSQSFNYYKQLVDKNEDFITFTRAQAFLNDSKRSLLLFDKQSGISYKNDENFRKKIDAIHSVDYFIKKNDTKSITNFARRDKACGESYILVVHSLAYYKIQFISLNQYQKLNNKLK
jgi:hypothetical protein